MAMSGQKAAAKLEKGIGNIKNILFCLNVVSWICGAIIFALSLWIRFDSEIRDWVDKLDIEYFYLGVYILLFGSFAVLILAFLGCVSALTENPVLLLANSGAQLLCFLVELAGAAILKDFSSYESSLQPTMRRVILRLISLYPLDSDANFIIRSVQENIGCCGADGALDYLNMKKPVPSECRDAVTGNVYFHGCVDEMTWILEDRTSWACNVALTLCFMHVVNAVLSFSLLQAVKKQDEVIAMYNR